MSRPHSFKTVIDARAAEIRVHEPTYVADVAGAKHFKVIVFDAENKILAIRTKKTIDLPSGRVEWEDDTLADAVRREVRETADVTLGPLALIAVLVTTPVEEGPRLPCDTTLVVASRAVRTGASQATLREHRYAFLPPAKLVQRYNGGPTELLSVLTEMASFLAG